jgi:hypothetical protein
VRALFIEINRTLAPADMRDATPVIRGRSRNVDRRRDL